MYFTYLCRKMWFLNAVTWVAYAIQILFFTLSLAAGLYYLAELVEEYTIASAQIITAMIYTTLLVHIGFLCFEEMSVWMGVCGIASSVMHLMLMKNFPAFSPTCFPFLASIVLLIIHHVLTFQFFGENFYNFSEVLSYFTICLWLVPFAFFVSLSANDHTLPVLSTPIHDTSAFSDSGDNDPQFYGNQKGKKYGLKRLFEYCRDTVIPSSTKRWH